MHRARSGFIARVDSTLRHCNEKQPQILPLHCVQRQDDSFFGRNCFGPDQ
jgi:hypothetical protein